MKFVKTFFIVFWVNLKRGLRISHRAGSRAAAASKMERFMIIVNGFQLLTIITKRSILDVAAALDPPLIIILTVAKESTNESATVIGEDADLFILLLYHTFSQT